MGRKKKQEILKRRNGGSTARSTVSLKSRLVVVYTAPQDGRTSSTQHKEQGNSVRASRHRQTCERKTENGRRAVQFAIRYNNKIRLS